MSVNNDLQSLVSNPEWLPSHWQADRRAIQFAYLPRQARSALTFLADEYLDQAQPPFATADLSQLREAAIANPAPAHFIFHSAFAASTLLARALDVPGLASTLQEPQILNDLAEAARRRALPGELPGMVLSLLARPLGPGERVIVKPSNAANLIAPAMMDASPGSRAIFLSAALPRFLRSLADKGLWGRRWGRRLYAMLTADTGVDFGLRSGELFELTDMQVAALAWLMHQTQKLALLQRFGDRLRILDSETFLTARAETLAAVAAHFGLALDDEQARQIADGPAFRTHSKELGREVDPEQPLAAREAIPIIEEEIEMVATWARAMAEHAGLSLQTPAQALLLPAA